MGKPGLLDGARDLIQTLEMSSNGLTTFMYIADSRNQPIPPGEKVWIVGAMTKGKLAEMKATDQGTHFVYKLDMLVEPGHKYTFCFKIGHIFTADVHFGLYTKKSGYSRLPSP